MHTLMTSMITVSCRVEGSFQHYFPVCNKSKFSIREIQNEIHLVIVLGVLEASYNWTLYQVSHIPLNDRSCVHITLLAIVGSPSSCPWCPYVIQIYIPVTLDVLALIQIYIPVTLSRMVKLHGEMSGMWCIVVWLIGRRNLQPPTSTQKMKAADSSEVYLSNELCGPTFQSALWMIISTYRMHIATISVISAINWNRCSVFLLGIVIFSARGCKSMPEQF